MSKKGPNEDVMTLASLITAPSIETEPKKLGRKAREAAMFADWYAGMTQTEIAAKYGIASTQVYRTKVRCKWDAAAARILERAQSKTVTHWKKLSVALTDVLMKDTARLQATLSESNTRQLSHDERQHVRALLENINKMTRLEDSKPTEIADHSGVVEHRVILPPQATRWGVIPPADNVKQVADKEKIEDAEIIEDIE